MKTMRNLIVLTLIAFIAVSCKTNQPEAKVDAAPEVKIEKKEYHNYLTDREEAEGWILLFGGDSISGWRNFGREGIEGWKAENGEMIALGEGGDHGNDIITVDQYKDFEFEVEWNVEPAGNSGIFFGVVEEGFKKVFSVYATGPEYQLLDDNNEKYNDLPDVRKTAANYAMEAAAETKKLNPAGEWNKSKIVKEGAHVQHWLNDELVLEYDLWTDEWKEQKANCKWKDYDGYGMAKKGHIALQDHGGVTRFRNIKIRPIE